MQTDTFDNRSATALVVIDMLNPYEHEDADALASSVETIIEPLADLISRAGGAADRASTRSSRSPGGPRRSTIRACASSRRTSPATT